MAFPGDVVPQHPQQHGAVDPVGGVKAAVGDRVEPGDECLFRLDLRGAASQRNVVDAIVIVAHAARGGIDRMDRQPPGPMIVHNLAKGVMGRLGLGQNWCGDGEEEGDDLAHGTGDRVSRPVWQEDQAGGSGRGDAVRFDDAVASVVAADPDPLFDQIDRDAQQHQPVAAAPIALEQEAGGVADQSTRFIHSRACFCSSYIHRFSLSRP